MPHSHIRIQYTLFMWNPLPFVGSMCARGLAAGDSFTLLCVHLTGVIYMYMYSLVMTVGITHHTGAESRYLKENINIIHVCAIGRIRGFLIQPTPPPMNSFLLSKPKN